jgi:hypothetical protein
LNLGLTTDPKTQADREERIVQTCAVLTTEHFVLITQQPLFAGTCTSFWDDPSDFPETFPFTGEPLQDCIAYMSSIPYGTFDRAESNTFTCRSLHTLITPLRPDVHCPRASTTGGMVCVDKPLADYFDQEF